MLVLLAGTLCGCRSYHRNMFQARDLFYQNDVTQASETLVKEQKKVKNRKNMEVLKLDEASMKMSQGDFFGAEALLREVRDTLDANEAATAKKTSKQAASLLTDDNTLSYQGEDYEKVMTRVMLALCSLMTDAQDVHAYANQINLKQQEIIERSDVNPDTKEKTKKGYRYLAVGAYLNAILNEASFTNEAGTLQEYQRACAWADDFHLRKALAQHLQNPRHSQPGNGVVHVFVLLGRGPYKVESDAPVTQLSLLAADRIVSAVSKHSVPPTIASVPIARVEQAPCPYVGVDVLSDGKPISRTATLTDVGQLAVEQFEINQPWILARAIARRVLKKGAIYGVKEVADVDTTGEILLDVAGILWEATEEADTRCWSLLPSKIQVARLELPAGEHKIDLRAAGSGASMTYPTTVSVENGRDTFVFATIADQGLVGKISVR